MGITLRRGSKHMVSQSCLRCVLLNFSFNLTPHTFPIQSRDLAAISPTGTGKTLSYLLPMMAALGAPISSGQTSEGRGVRAVILAPTRELAHQIHNECMKLAQGRKWRIILFNKATASTLASKDVRDKVGKFVTKCYSAFQSLTCCRLDIVVSTPLRLVASLQTGKLELNKYVVERVTTVAILTQSLVFVT